MPRRESASPQRLDYIKLAYSDEFRQMGAQEATAERERLNLKRCGEGIDGDELERWLALGVRLAHIRQWGDETTDNANRA